MITAQSQFRLAYHAIRTEGEACKAEAALYRWTDLNRDDVYADAVSMVPVAVKCRAAFHDRDRLQRRVAGSFARKAFRRAAVGPFSELEPGYFEPLSLVRRPNAAAWRSLEEE